MYIKNHLFFIILLYLFWLISGTIGPILSELFVADDIRSYLGIFLQLRSPTLPAGVVFVTLKHPRGSASDS